MTSLRLALDMFTRSWRASPGRTAIILLTIICQFSATIVIAILQRAVVDAAGGSALTLVTVMAAGLALALTADFVTNRVQGNLRAIVDIRVGYGLAHELSTWASTNPQLEIYDRPDVLDRMHHVRAQHRTLVGLGWSVVIAVAVSANVLASLVLLTRINPWLMGVAVLAIAPLVLSQRSRRYVQRANEQASAVERQEIRLHGLTSDPELAAELRISQNEAAIDQHCRDLWRRAQLIRRRGQLRAGLLSYAGWLVFGLGYVGSIAFTAALAIRDEATLGDLALVLGLAEGLRWRVLGVVQSVSAVNDGTRIAREYLTLKESYDDALVGGWTATAPARLDQGISLRGVSYRYPDHEQVAVDDVSLDIPAGSVVALLGENGAGKTTLVKLLLGQYTPAHGQIEIDGIDLATIDPRQWALRCSGLVQDFAKLEGPVREAVAAGGLQALTRSQVRAAIDDAHAGDIVDALSDGVDTALGISHGTAGLSHGQWQRLALARGLTRTTPLLLVLDEPTSALDPEVEHRLFDSFFRRARGVARTHGSIAVVVSHRLSTTQDADLIVVMDHGTIVEVGDHATLVKAHGRYADLYALQSHAYR